ncbi:hypothetical protein [Croceivirga thetidis]|uniref:Riboflavin synthase subunit beta n=1 Tax=Croceivirga thetidis TaxID=2721623 RepID=A0ABX1GTC4_9FLAO|nr:hypothetical protein [Croceivirga thetidis]NKI32160.1 hypothetical protein [Croceivirga thetidis]
MGGEGSMMHAIKSLKQNRNLLKRRKQKTKDDVYGVAVKTKLNLKQSTPADVLKVKRQMQEYNRQLRVKGFIAGILVFMIIVLVTAYISSQL